MSLTGAFISQSRDAARSERAAHKSVLEISEGLVGHKKADLLYEIAWDMGHSAGYHEVEIYYHQMAALLK